MNGEENQSSEKQGVAPMDVEFIPYILVHKVHRNLKSSQVEIVPINHYFKETTPEPEPEVEGEPETEIPPPTVIYAPPLPALKEKKNWWDFFRPVYGFNEPRIRSRLEKLMNSWIVYITDRKYMIKLQEKIKEDHLKNLKRRIKEREADEMEREKNLILEGKIPFEDAPEELRIHPIFIIGLISEHILKERKSWIKHVTKMDLYKTPLARIRAAEKALRETVFVKVSEDDDISQSVAVICDTDADALEDIAKGFMFTEEEYELLKYEYPEIKNMKLTDTVNELYTQAERIVFLPKPPLLP